MRSQRFAECRILCISETIESKNHTVEKKEVEKKSSVVILCKNENKMEKR